MSMPSPRSDSPAARRLFAVLLALLGVYYLWLHLSRRIPLNHDTQYAFILQNLFLSQTSGEDSLLLWFPYSTQGIVSSWYLAAGGMVHSVLVFFGVPTGTNTVPLFHAGMMFEELVLLVGTWRLSRFFLRTPSARVLVSLSVVGASFWAQQVWHNHRATFAIPLVLSFFHEFFEEGRRSRLFLGVNLLFLQFIGNLSYVAVMVHLIVGTWLVVHVVVHRRSLRSRWDRLRPRPIDAALLLVNIAVLVCIYVTLTHGTREIALYSEGRTAEGAVSLTDYLTYPGELDPVRYGDLFFGISRSLDYTIFCGIGAVPLAVLAFSGRPGRTVFFLAVCLFLFFLLSLGYLSAVGMPAYLLPPVRFFRYITLTLTYVRLPLILLAGVGFESLFAAARRNPARSGMIAVAFGALGLTCGIFALLYGGHHGDPVDLVRLFLTPTPGLLSFEGHTDASLAQAFGSAGLAAVAAAAALAALAIRPQHHRAILAILLVILAADVVRWRVMMTRERTLALDDEQYRAQETAPLPYVRRRSLDLSDLPPGRKFVLPVRKKEPFTARYDTFEHYLHRDPPISPFTTSHLMIPVRKLLLAHAGRPLDARASGILESWAWNETDAPSVRPPYDKIMGMSTDKLQVFSGAQGVPTDQETADRMNAAGFRGDTLFVASPRPSPSGSRRIDVPVEVVSFDANHLRAKLTIPPGDPNGWLLYCDAWHSAWSATVNGKDVPVARAFLAYKAVPLEAGSNVVEFRMKSPVRVWTFRLAALNAGLWLVGVVVLVGMAFRKPTAAPAASAGA